MNRTTIEWTDYTWNPVTGCTKVSQGCKNCYAETMTKRFAKTWGVKSFRDVVCHPDRLMEPCYMGEKMHGKKVFVCDMSDLFHEDVPVDFIGEVFETISNCPDTIFQILTKRPDRALKLMPEISDRALLELPLPNVWIGTSCEDQATANERIPLLLHIPAAVRFLSCEPLLGPIDLTAINLVHRNDGVTPPSTHFDNVLTGYYYSLDHKNKGAGHARGKKIHWVIAGGESGRNARPMHPDWVRSLRDQCAAAGVPFFFKQWGEWMPLEFDAQPPFREWSCGGPVIDGHGIDVIDPETGGPGRYKGKRFMDAMDAITYCFEYKARQCDFLRAGKTHSKYNYLDGKQHLEFPA